MKIFILDSDALIRRLDLCLRPSGPPSDIRIMVPDVALQVFDLPRFNLFRATVLAAMEQNSIGIVRTAIEPNLKAERAANLSRAQLAVGQFARSVAETATKVDGTEVGSNEVFIVTTSRDLEEYCKSAGIIGISPNKAAKLLPPRSRNPWRLLWSGASRWFPDYLRTIARNTLLFVLLMIALVLIVHFQDPLWDYLKAQPLASALLCFIVAVFAFWIRSKYRLQYAVVEIVVGVVLVLLAVFHHGTRDINQDDLLKAASGIYVIVRGLDNLGKALMGSRVGLLWWRVFGD